MVNAKKARRMPVGSQPELPPGVDSKLLHLVRRLMSEQSCQCDSNGNFQPDIVMASLCTKYREYQRKEPGNLLQSVQAAIRHVVSTNDINPALHRESQEEEDDENDALEEERIRAGFRNSQGSGLNAGLRERYKKIQATREIPDIASADQDSGSGSLEKSDFATELSSSKDQKMKTDTDDRDVERVSISSSAHKRRRIRISAPGFSLPNGQDSNTQPSFLKPVRRPTERYSDLGGMDDVIKDIRQLVEYPLVRPELYQHLGVDPPRGVLLRGPPGT